MKLISMTDYVVNTLDGKVLYLHLEKVLNYAKFLKQRLKLSMFVPCDLDSNILEEPYTLFTNDSDEFDEYTIEYCKAKELILFKGFEYDKSAGGIKKGKIYDRVWISEIDLIEMTIEDLLKYDLELTPAAKKQFNI